MMKRNCETHGHAHRGKHTPTYRIWLGIRYRCRHKGKPNYDYLPAGAEVCERWNSYENFLADMGERPAGMSLDRVDNTKGYSPDNCRWATQKQQQNNRTNNKEPITYNGETRSVADWAAHIGIAYKTLWKRLYTDKMPLDKAFRNKRDM